MNVITARFTYGNRARTDPITRLDYGWVLRFENANLPETYQVDFSNDPSNSGTSKTSIGNSDGVEIPQEFCVPGQNVYGFVYLVGENSGRTRYFTETFVQARPDRSGRTPTPTQQDTVDQAIAALNAAVTEANAAIQHYPMITGGVWYVWDVTAGEYASTGVAATGADGVSPFITVTEITGGHRVTVTDAQGPHTFDVMDGEDGEPGTDGANAYVYIRYSANEPASDSDMKTTPDAWIGIYSGDAATAPTHYTDYVWYEIKGDPGPAGVVQDVQVNGVSVLNDGVANVPQASGTTPGVVKVSQSGTNGIVLNSEGLLRVERAPSAEIKAGMDNKRPIVPENQHSAVFYGLAKAADDTSQAASSNAVGAYTEGAKSKIRKMLGAQSSEWTLINSVVPSANDTDEIEFVIPDGYKSVCVYCIGTNVTTNRNVRFVFNGILRNPYINNFQTASVPNTRFEVGEVTGAYRALKRNDVTIDTFNTSLASNQYSKYVNTEYYFGGNTLTSLKMIALNLLWNTGDTIELYGRK